VSCHDLTALLTLVGLAAELYAVFRILRSVGVGDSTAARIERRLARIRARVRTWLGLRCPWMLTPLKLRWANASAHCVEQPPHDLHVLPRHRLLRQAGGFERFSADG
jgi:hypothetical protein